MLSKLLGRKKDDCELLKFLDDTKLLFNDVNKFKSVNIDMDLNDVSSLIDRTKKLYTQSKKVEDCLISKKDDKKYKLQLLLLKDKLKQLNELVKVVEVYEKQLQEYKSLAEIKKNVKKNK